MILVFKRIKSTDERSFDTVFEYVLQKHISSTETSLIQGFVDTNLPGKTRKYFDLPPLIATDEKPLKYIADQIASLVLFSEKNMCERVKPELEKSENWGINLEFQAVLKMLTTTGTALLVAALL